jgi:hypothetical protein
MRVFTAHQPPVAAARAEGPLLLRDSFAWGACLFGGFWLLLHRLWFEALAWLGVALLALMMFWPEIEGKEGRMSFRRGPAMVAEALQVTAPLYQGLDELNRPYTVTARLARQLELLKAQEAAAPLREPSAVQLPSAASRFSVGGSSEAPPHRRMPPQALRPAAAGLPLALEQLLRLARARRQVSQASPRLVVVPWPVSV